ncbi:hypothetical protein DYBT9275_05858 [Dyadobacter sp. CECT 9275]|uniref:Uncharacterized protein n=1 Tax=Dyadobacter helix TaxID=2822344 RepID=A0A916NE67_9BACT|nr:DUF6544 family protein [Dyadobacter sp. CECT 9275]CAG5017846.1 hypothetical protein DYBT9275_05858 [Dyadobacter sp. CECT 9275]
MGTTSIYPQVASTLREKRTFSVTFKVTIAIAALLCFIYLTGRLYLYLKFTDEVAELFSHSKDISSSKFAAKQLAGLPRPVENYFRHVLKEGQPYISNVHLVHDGLFKTDLKKDWIAISGEEYFTADKPGFIWKGKTTSFTARDMFIKGRGRLVVSLFSLFTIENQTGEKFDTGELMRWLGESVCFPTNLLPSQNLRWLPIDDNSAKLEFEYGNLSASFTVIFDASHQIAELRGLRHMGDGPKQLWVTKVSHYKSWNGVLIPTVLEAGWEIEKKYLPYARFTVQDLTYNGGF